MARKGVPLSPEHRAKLSAARTGKPGYWTGKKRGEHSAEWRANIAAGVRGVTRSVETREKIRQAFLGKPRSAETLAKMRIAIDRPEAREKMRQNVLGKPCRHPARVPYNGRLFRSTYEVRVATALDALGIAWEYEAHRFDLGDSTYAPDFFLPEENVFWEVKGWFGPDSQRKVAAFRARYPDVSLVVFPLMCIVQLEQAVTRAA